MNNMEYMKLLLNVGLILAAFCINNSNSDPCSYWTNDVLPKHYSIQLIPNMKMEHMSKGNLVASIEICRETNNFTMDILDLQIIETGTYMRDTNNEKYVPNEYHYDNVQEMLTLYFEEELVKGSYDLVMEFISSSPKDRGFYTKLYNVTSTEGPHMIAVTQTEDFTARQTFPCWDEPGLKATFDISVKHDKKYRVLSNMPQKKTKTELNVINDTMWTEFETTPKMSTHLVAVVVFDPIYISNTFISKTVTIWCRPHVLSEIELLFTANLVNDIIEHLSNYTSFYNVPKINIVILPDSFITKTVSSWGLIICRESDFVQKDEDITGMKRHIANFIANHVIRHWFGNLVTPTKWTWIWLREGFVTFFKSYILNMIFKDWQSMDMLVVEDIHSALYNDMSYYMTSVVSQDVRFTLSSLDKFQYYKTQYLSHAPSAKASALLRMLRFLVNDNVFQKGIIAYFANNAYGSTNSDSVWHEMQHILIDEYFKSHMQDIHIDNFVKHTNYYDSKISEKKFRISRVMDAYMTQNRYPLVLVKRNYTTGETIISQELFAKENKNIKWWIPLTFATQTNPDFSNTSFTWLSPDDENVTLTFESNDWIIVNLQRYGYYRVNYDETNWQRITDYLNSDNYVNIHVLNRAQLIDDAYALVKYIKIKGSTFLNLTKYLSRESSYVVWHTMFRILALSSEYFLLLESTNLKSHFSEILGSRLEKLGYEEDPNEDDFTKLERRNATYWACYFGNTECRRTATSKLINYLDDPENYDVSPYWQEWTFCAGLMAANMTIWDKAKDIYFKKSNQRFYEFLACAEQPNIIKKYLDIWKTLRNSTLEEDDLDVIFNLIVKRHGRNDEILNYIIKNFETLIPNKSSRRHKIVNHLILHVHSLAQLQKVENLTRNEFQSQPEYLTELQDTITVRRSNVEFLTFFFSSRFLI